jgi:hypothetical protein
MPLAADLIPLDRQRDHVGIGQAEVRRRAESSGGSNPGQLTSPEVRTGPRTYRASAGSLRQLVGVLLGGELLRSLEDVLEVALLNRQRPQDELANLVVAGGLVHRLQHRPVAELGAWGASTR